MRDGSGGDRICVCPFSNCCGCRVRYRVWKSNSMIRWQCNGKHDSESHSVDNTRQGLRLEQRASVERVARAHPTSSTSQVRHKISQIRNYLSMFRSFRCLSTAMFSALSSKFATSFSRSSRWEIASKTLKVHSLASVPTYFPRPWLTSIIWEASI